MIEQCVLISWVDLVQMNVFVWLPNPEGQWHQADDEAKKKQLLDGL